MSNFNLGRDLAVELMGRGHGFHRGGRGGGGSHRNSDAEMMGFSLTKLAKGAVKVATAPTKAVAHVAATATRAVAKSPVAKVASLVARPVAHAALNVAAKAPVAGSFVNAGRATLDTTSSVTHSLIAANRKPAPKPAAVAPVAPLHQVAKPLISKAAKKKAVAPVQPKNSVPRITSVKTKTAPAPSYAAPTPSPAPSASFPDSGGAPYSLPAPAAESTAAPAGGSNKMLIYGGMGAVGLLALSMVFMPRKKKK